MSDQVALAVLGAAFVAVGIALGISVALGLVVAGVEMLAGAYVGAYLKVRTKTGGDR